jgi:Zn-dependent metalloprotease
VGFKAGFHGDLMAESQGNARQKARAFVSEYSRMLGVRDADAELTLVGERTDKLGQHHLTFEQSYRGVPVFAGLLRAHFEGDGRLTAVNGNLVPGIRVNPVPSRSASEAAATAIALIAGENGREVYARSGVLTVYRTGLVQGIEGESYLTWQVEVGNGSDIREFIYVDAHSGKVIDRLPGIMAPGVRRGFPAVRAAVVPGFAGLGRRSAAIPGSGHGSQQHADRFEGNVRLFRQGFRSRLFR